MDFLNHPETDRIIEGAFREDLGEGDHTTLALIAADRQSRARCLIKEDGILAGVALAEKVFHKLDSSVKLEVLKQDGDPVQQGEVAFYVEGNTRALLSGERLMLNLMQRMSGIATYTRRLVQELEGLDCKLLDTRKTTPLIRHFEKWAVKIGGAENHRFGLYDMVMIKDNHHDLAGGIRAAVEAVHAYLAAEGVKVPIEVETRNLEEVQEAIDVGGIQRIMLDNMEVEEMRAAVALIDGRFEVEASGNIGLHNLREKAATGVDFVSMGALTHSVKSLDISLKSV